MEIKEAEADLREAERASDDLASEVRAEIEAATAEIKARFHDRTDAAWRAKYAAYNAVLAAKDRTPDHPWTGKRVFRMGRDGGVGSRALKRIEGVVEMRRTATAFPANTARYSLPSMGQAFVRLLKADGTPGTRFSQHIQDWKLVDDAPALDTPHD